MGVAPKLWALRLLGAVTLGGKAGLLAEKLRFLRWIMATNSPMISPELMELLSSIR
jgi:hypothetical protein